MLGGGGRGIVKGAGRILGGIAGRIGAGFNAARGAIASGAGRLLAVRGIPMASGLASAGAGTATAGVAAAGATGYAIGEHIVNPAINWAARKYTGNEHETLGTWIYDLFNQDKTRQIEEMYAQTFPAALPQKQDVDVNAKIEIGLPPGFVVQKQGMDASGGNVRMSTGNINTDAP
jgi:hypothetical protein